MFQEVLAETELIALPLFALLLFATVFTIVVLRVWRRADSRDQHTYLASLPLADDVVSTSEKTRSGNHE